MDKYHFFFEPTKTWHDVCHKNENIIHSEEWQQLLSKSFNSMPIYCWDDDQQDGFVITVFRTGPFRVGYIGFPTGGTIKSQPITQAVVEKIKKSLLPKRIDLIHFANSAFSQSSNIQLPYTTTLETAIIDLKNWDQSKLSKTLRADIRHALENQIKIIEIIDLNEGVEMYNLYRQTIKKHSGNLRYSKKYFYHLIELSIKQKNLKCLEAIIDNKSAGYFIVLKQGIVAYYLHGANDPLYQKYRGSDLLFLEAIKWTKNIGTKEFNFMSSPINQPSLIFYKEKWGGITKEQKNYTLIINTIKAEIFTGLKNIRDGIDRLFRK